MKALSQGWVETTIGEIADASSGFGFPKHLQGKTKGRFPFAKVGDISLAVRNSGGRLSAAENYVDDADLKLLKARTVPAGATVFAKIGEGLKLNRRALTTVSVALDNNCMALSPRANIESQFLFDFLRTVDLGPLSVATTVPSIRKGDIEAIRLLLPPLPEQRRIVAKIDSLSGKSKRARDHLEHIPLLVKKYKQAILTKAYSRKTSNAVALVPLSNFCLSIADGDHQAPPRADHGVPFITISAMNSGRIDLAKATRFVPQSYFDSLKATRRPQLGDVLYSVTGSYGIPALVRERTPFVFQRHISILRPNPGSCNPRWLSYIMAAPQVLDQASAVATGTAQLTVPLGGLRAFQLPNATLDEQRQIVRYIEHAFMWIERLASEATSARKLINHLDQTVLAKAFRGELMPLDPDDEPANLLLDRIKVEEGAGATSKPQHKPNK